MPDGPRDFDTEFTASIGGVPARRRVGFDVDRGTITRFVVQLEYLIDPISGTWDPVIRYDHDAEGSDEATHDVTEEGLHIDVFRDGVKIESHELTPPIEANMALKTAEEHIAEHLDRYVHRFEQWHGINPGGP